MKSSEKNFQIGSLLVYTLISENGFFFVWVNLIKRDKVLLLHQSNRVVVFRRVLNVTVRCNK